MPFIDTVKRIKTDEFKKEDREVAERIGNIYNYFAEQVTNVLNGNIDFSNLQRSVITLTVIVDANGTPTNTLQFSNNIGLQGVQVIRAVNTTNRVNFVTGQPFVSFTSEGTGVYTIENIKGLNPNENYTLTIELIF